MFLSGKRNRWWFSFWLTGMMFACCCTNDAAGQGSFSFQLRGLNTITPVPDGDTLLLGRDPRATYCVDPYVFIHQGLPFIEYELPPSPPGFDIRSINYRPGTGGCTGNTTRSAMRNDIRGSFSRAQIDTFRIKYSQGEADSIKFSWPTGLSVFCDSMRLQDLFGGALGIKVNMLTTQSFAIDNSDLLLNVLIWGAPAVDLVAPADGSTVSPSVTLSWGPRPGATVYHLQVATDSVFANNIVNDSTISATSRLLSGLIVKKEKRARSRCSREKPPLPQSG